MKKLLLLVIIFLQICLFIGCKDTTGKKLTPPPLSAKECYEKAISYAAKNKYDEAILYFNKALNLEPKNITYLNKKGTVLHEAGKYEYAIKCFNKTLEINPENKLAQEYKEKSTKGLTLGSLYEEGNKLYNADKYTDAIKVCDEILEINSNEKMM